MNNIDPPYELIGKYLSGEATLSEQEFLTKWREQSSENNEEYMLIAMSWAYSFNSLDQYEKKKEDVYQETLKLINRKNSNRKKSKPLLIWGGVAASVILLLTAWFTLQVKNEVTPKIFASKQEIKQVTLSDGTKVWLNSNSQLSVNPDFNKKSRMLELKGEAYFEVAKDQNKPFIIIAGNSRTEVLGTAFNIKEKSREGVLLMVTEGVVSFSNSEITVEEKLIKGEQAILAVDQSEIKKDLIQDFNRFAWKTKMLNFRNSSLEHIAKSLSNYYQVEIEVSESIKQEQVSIQFDQNQIDDALKILAETTDITVEKLESGLFLLK